MTRPTIYDRLENENPEIEPSEIESMLDDVLADDLDLAF